MATDTAFALGVLALVRKHIPVSLLAFIVGLAIVDDVGVVFGFSSFIDSLQHPTGLGIITGLVVGKFIGISGAQNTRFDTKNGTN